MPDPRFYLTAPAVAAAEAVALAGADLQRAGQRPIARAAAIDEGDLSDAVVFAETAQALAEIGARGVGLCLVSPAHAARFKGEGALGVAAAPKLAFARLAARLHRERPFDPKSGAPRSASQGAGASIHPAAIVDPSAEIGDGAVIGPGAIIGPGVVIGAECVVSPRAVVTFAIVGARTRILAGAVIGEAGFGFVLGPEGMVRLPQLGRVLIGRDVEIGANACIDRGALGDTVIADGVKIDNLVQIGHNVRVGRDSVMAAQTGVSGSVRIGAGVLMGGQVGMADHLVIGDGAQLAAQSGVMRDVPPGEKWAGAPAKPAKTWFREITLLATLAAKKRANRNGQD